MSATIAIEPGPITATLDGWQWTSSDKTLERLLNSMLSPNGPGGEDPDPEYHAAKAAADHLGGRVVKSDLVDYDPKAVY